MHASTLSVVVCFKLVGRHQIESSSAEVQWSCKQKELQPNHREGICVRDHQSKVVTHREIMEGLR
jgi:hypothetical protein